MKLFLVTICTMITSDLCDVKIAQCVVLQNITCTASRVGLTIALNNI